MECSTFGYISEGSEDIMRSKVLRIAILNHPLWGPSPDRLTAAGRCALQTSRSLAMSQAASSASPTLTPQLADPSLSGTNSWTFPFRPVIWSVTCTRVDSHLHCAAGTSPRRARTRTYLNIEIYISHGSVCCRCFSAESGSTLIHFAQSRTSEPQAANIIYTNLRVNR